MQFNFYEAFKNLYRLIIFLFYFLIELYEYYALLGLYCLEIKDFDGWSAFVSIFFYQNMTLFKIIYYIQIINSSSINTTNLFPHISHVKRKIPKSINYFIKNDLINSTSRNVKTCDICMTIKPPRAHHCKICEKCFLKYDHHCIFLKSCIGYYNYKYFYQLITLDTFQTIFFIILISLQLKLNIDVGIYSSLIVSLSISSLKLIILICLSFFHTILISRNETTVEWMALNSYLQNKHEFSKIFQEGPISELSDSKNRKILNPYNLNIKNNWIQVFGNNVFEWISPTQTTEINGISFPKNYRSYDDI